MSDGTGTNAAGADFAPPPTTEQEQSNRHSNPWKRRVTLAFGLVALVTAAIVLPPLVNIGRYQKQITALMSRSLGRPVHLSDVELRLLPRPGFVLHDLSVGEDPAFGAEPILSARTVVASVGILPLWRGRLEVTRVSVDEASLNLVHSGPVRSGQGRWNLESLMMGAQPEITGLKTGKQTGSGTVVPFPYLEATNSRVNLKNGAEKGPFSIVDTDLSLWQDEPGAWRVRLRGEPVRTDMQMSSADTGEVRMEATLRTGSNTATELGSMPLKLQLEWREAQLGQLSRLVLGSDAGWRGNLTADVEVQGTMDAAQTKARVRAIGVRRAEFAPDTPLDFDANCSFRYEHSKGALRDVGCDTAIGDGVLHLKANLPGVNGQPEAMLEVKQIPLQAGLDLLRTVRGGFAPGIVAKGLANGSLVWTSTVEAPATGNSKARKSKKREESPAGQQSLQGSLTLDGVQLKGGALKDPLMLPKMTWAPTEITKAGQGGGFKQSLGSWFLLTLPPAATAKAGSVKAVGLPQTIAVRLGVGADGYEAGASGSANTEKVRELAYAFGLPHLDALDSLSGGTTDMDLTVAGPWIASDLGQAAASGPASVAPGVAGSSDQKDNVSGSLDVHRAECKAPYLARAVELPLGKVAFSDGHVSITSDFVYGAVKGTVAVTAATECTGPDCAPQVQLHFGALDAGALQLALLGAPAEKSLLSPLLDRMRTSDRPKWPTIAVTVEAESFALGTVTLHSPIVKLRFKESEVALESWEARLLGGVGKGTGKFAWVGDKPEYSLDGEFAGVSGSALGSLLGTGWTGGPVNGTGSVKLTGFTDKDLAASTVGKVDFQWVGGTVEAPAAVRFSEWNGTVTLGGGKATLGENSLVAGRQKTAVTGGVAFGAPVKLETAQHKKDDTATVAKAPVPVAVK